MQTTFNHAKITHILTMTPQNRINIDDELHTRYQGDIRKFERIKKSVGLKYRYEADNETTASDLGEYWY